MNIRMPAVAGQFYPQDKSALEKQLSRLFPDEEGLLDAKGIIVPHAGYVYSGSVAASTISKIKSKELYIIIGPNHTGGGEPFSLMSEGLWRTPLGDVLVDTKFSKRLLEISEYLKDDDEAHINEHSIEVELPFLQHKKKPFMFVPIIVTVASMRVYGIIANELVRCIKELSAETTIIASSDFTHYEDSQSASKKDKLAIDAILELDEKKFLNVVKEHDITACGYAPIAIMLASAKLLGAKNARLVKYQTSGDVSGDYESVVGYAGIIIT
jgi:AmmeMemoRadiSam system protein B